MIDVWNSITLSAKIVLYFLYFLVNWFFSLVGNPRSHFDRFLLVR